MGEGLIPGQNTTPELLLYGCMAKPQVTTARSHWGLCTSKSILPPASLSLHSLVHNRLTPGQNGSTSSCCFPAAHCAEFSRLVPAEL